MRAVQIKAFGAPETLALVDMPAPVPEPGMALVRVEAASINPSDVKNVAGAMKQTTLPRIPGRDYAGVVEQGPAEWIGAQVWGSGGDSGFTRNGTHAELVAVPAASLRHKPSILSFVEAAVVGVNFITAWSGLVGAAQIKAGETLAIIGAGGGVGGAAAQIAHHLGARIIGIDRHAPRDDAPIRAHAAHMIIGAADIPAALRQATDGKGADVVFDTVGGVMFPTALACLAWRGRLIEISVTGQREVSFDLADFYHNESRLLGVDSLKLDLTASAGILEALAPGFESGAYHPAPIAEIVDLADARAGYRKVADGVVGRIVIAPRP
jgi:NADPH2:quinone reductase